MEIKTVSGVRHAAWRLQRDRRLRKVREQAVKWTTEGAGNRIQNPQYTATSGTRQLPGI